VSLTIARDSETAWISSLSARYHSSKAFDVSLRWADDNLQILKSKGEAMSITKQRNFIYQLYLYISLYIYLCSMPDFELM